PARVLSLLRLTLNLFLEGCLYRFPVHFRPETEQVRSTAKGFHSHLRETHKHGCGRAAVGEGKDASHERLVAANYCVYLLGGHCYLVVLQGHNGRAYCSQGRIIGAGGSG